MPIPKPRRNVYDILSREQIWAVVDLVEQGIEDKIQLRETESDYTQEDIDGINATIARGTEAIELFAADLRPEHGPAHAVAQLTVLDLRSTEDSKLIELTPAVRLALQMGANQLLTDAAAHYNAGAITTADELREKHREVRAVLDTDGALQHTSSEVLHAARAVLGVLGEEGGWQPGEFERRLILAFEQADDENAERLASVFPAYAVAIRTRHASGADGLRALLPAKIQ